MRTMISLLMAILLCCGVFGTCTAAAEPGGTTSEDLPVTGQETEEAAGFQILNSTGADIIYFSILKEEKNETERMKDIQTVLQEKGLYTLEIDGLYGPGTQKAVEEFRHLNDLEEGNEIDAELLFALFGWGNDGNLLLKEEPVKNGETGTVSAPSAAEGDNENYRTAIIKLAGPEDGREDKYLLRDFPILPDVLIEICMEDDQAYICYQLTENEEIISTLQIETEDFVEAENDEYFPEIKNDMEDWEPAYTEEETETVSSVEEPALEPALEKDHADVQPLYPDYDPMLFTDKERPLYESCDHEWETIVWPDGSEMVECGKCHVTLSMWLYNGYSE